MYCFSVTQNKVSIHCSCFNIFTVNQLHLFAHFFCSRNNRLHYNVAYFHKHNIIMIPVHIFYFSFLINSWLLQACLFRVIFIALKLTCWLRSLCFVWCVALYSLTGVSMSFCIPSNSLLSSSITTAFHDSWCSFSFLSVICGDGGIVATKAGGRCLNSSSFISKSFILWSSTHQRPTKPTSSTRFGSSDQGTEIAEQRASYRLDSGS